MRFHVVALGTVLLLATAACSSPEDAPGGSLASTTAERLSADELRASLLTLGDMPEPGFTQTDPDPDRERTYFCDYEPPAQPSETVMSEFEKTDDVAFSLVRSVTDQFDSVDDAAAQIDAAATTLETCDSATVAGTEQKYRVLSAPDLGDRSLAVQITTKVGDVPVVMHQVYVQSGNAILQTSTAVGGADASADADDVADLARVHAKRFESVRP